MTFAVSSKRNQWSFDLGPDSVVLIVSDLVQKMTISSRKFLCLLEICFFPRARLFWQSSSPNPNQQLKFDLREEVLTSARAQDMDTTGNELSNKEDIEVIQEYPQVELDAVFRPGTVLSFRQKPSIDLELAERGSSGNPIVVDGGRQELFSNNSSVWASHWSSQVAQKLSFSKTDWKCART